MVRQLIRITALAKRALMQKEHWWKENPRGIDREKGE